MPSIPQQSRAHQIVFKAKQEGLLTPPDICEMCGATRRICAHHWRGYDHPLDVWWLCWRCNTLLDSHDGSLTKEQARKLLHSAYTPPDQDVPRERPIKPPRLPQYPDQDIIDHLAIVLRDDQSGNYWQSGCRAMQEHPLGARWLPLTDNQRRTLIRRALKQIRTTS